MKKALLVSVLVLVLVFAMIGPAAAHFIHVNTPSGESNCNFLGGPGNPGHEGHSHGHVKVIAHEGSSTVSLGGPCP